MQLGLYASALSCFAWLAVAEPNTCLDQSRSLLPKAAYRCREACESLVASGHSHLEVYSAQVPTGFEFYAAQQDEIIPLCVVRPRTADAVAKALNAATQSKCPFAVRSGGHSVAHGASNIQDGIVIDLKDFNQTIVSEDKQTAWVGAGNRWGDVYRVLESQGLAIVGGRVTSVGVGGFTLGGGISWLSRRYGWAINNIRQFEVVLPNGTVAYASDDLHPDLFFALRGGGGNFGIVTTINFKIYEHGLAWGGNNVYVVEDLPRRKAALGLQSRFEWTLYFARVKLSTVVQKAAVFLGYGMRSEDLVEAFVKLGHNEADTAPHAFLYLGWNPTLKAWLMGATSVYSEPIERPGILQNLTKPSGILSSNRFAPPSSFAHEINDNNPPGERQIWRTATFKLDAGLISKLWDILIEECEPVEQAVPDAMITTNLQLLTKPEIAMLVRNDGISFGMEEDDGPLFLYSITISYHSQKDDAAIQKLAEIIFSRSVDLGKEMVLHHRFIYPNYAAMDQDVFAGFSPQHQQRLGNIQRIYDPRGEYAALQSNSFWS